MTLARLARLVGTAIIAAVYVFGTASLLSLFL
nr:MAG TPA: hypothetical protein [Caudoviricetes sp.]